MTLKQAYDYGVYFLSANGVDEAEFKSLCLVCHLDGIKNSEFEFHKNDEIIMKKFADLLWRVKPVVIDLCSGSGCIGINIAKKVKASTVYLVEKSEKAFSYLLKNAKDVPNVNSLNKDIFALPQIEKADIIVSNPPYINSDDIDLLQKEVQREPRMALDGGQDGLDFYRFIAENYKDYLKPDGVLLFEIGETQADAVADILKSNSYSDIEIKKDIYGNARMAVCRKR